jgi:hypothetical protein
VEQEGDDIKGDGSGLLLLQDKEGYIIQLNLFPLQGQWYDSLRGGIPISDVGEQLPPPAFTCTPNAPLAPTRIILGCILATYLLVVCHRLPDTISS